MWMARKVRIAVINIFSYSVCCTWIRACHCVVNLCLLPIYGAPPPPPPPGGGDRISVGHRAWTLILLSSAWNVDALAVDVLPEVYALAKQPTNAMELQDCMMQVWGVPQPPELRLVTLAISGHRPGAPCEMPQESGHGS